MHHRLFLTLGAALQVSSQRAAATLVPAHRDITSHLLPRLLEPLREIILTTEINTLVSLRILKVPVKIPCVLQRRDGKNMEYSWCPQGLPRKDNANLSHRREVLRYSETLECCVVSGRKKVGDGAGLQECA